MKFNDCINSAKLQTVLNIELKELVIKQKGFSNNSLHKWAS